MQIKLKEVHKEGHGRDVVITYEVFSDKDSLGCHIVANRKTANFHYHGTRSFSLEEMEAISFEMRNTVHKLLTSFD